MTAPTTSVGPEADTETEAAGTSGPDPAENQATVTAATAAPTEPDPDSDPADSRPKQSAAALGTALRAGRGRRVARMVFTAASLLSVLLLGFGAYVFGLSKLQEQHSQANLYRVLAAEFAQATAPVGPAPDGAPLFIMDIPAIGLHQEVAVEGTTGSDLAKGLGHRRDTPLPGQPGVSVVMGRRGTFGAPFAKLELLQAGDEIHITTGEGSYTYTVNAFVQGSKPIVDPSSTNRLVLTTGDSTWIPTRAIYVGARLDGQPDAGSGQKGTYGDLDKPLTSDTDAWPPLQTWALALALAVAVTVALTAVWNRRAVYLSMAPVLAALLWCVYENAAILLPNIY